MYTYTHLRRIFHIGKKEEISQSCYFWERVKRMLQWSTWEGTWQISDWCTVGPKKAWKKKNRMKVHEIKFIRITVDRLLSVLWVLSVHCHTWVLSLQRIGSELQLSWCSLFLQDPLRFLWMSEHLPILYPLTHKGTNSRGRGLSCLSTQMTTWRRISCKDKQLVLLLCIFVQFNRCVIGKLTWQ